MKNKTDQELEKKYPLAYREVMANPLSLLWDNMGIERKKEILIGITKNIEIKKIRMASK